MGEPFLHWADAPQLDLTPEATCARLPSTGDNQVDNVQELIKRFSPGKTSTRGTSIVSENGKYWVDPVSFEARAPKTSQGDAFIVEVRKMLGRLEMRW